MKIFNNTKIPKNFEGSALAIGNFDGVHVGHKKVFQQTKQIAKKNKIKFGVLTFTPLPAMFFNKKLKNYRLTSEDQKLKLFKKSKVDFTINIKFSDIFFVKFTKKLSSKIRTIYKISQSIYTSSFLIY